MAKKAKLPPYETTDITLAASLMYFGFKLTGTYPSVRGRGEVLFEFDDDGTIDKYVLDYQNGDLKVDPNVMMNHLRNLKASIKRKI